MFIAIANPDNNGNGHSSFLNDLLPITDLIKAGREMRDLTSVENYARSVAQAILTTGYDPKGNPAHQLREAAYQKALRDLAETELSVAHAAATIKDAERQEAEQRQLLLEPRLDTKVLVAGIASLAISVAPPLHDLLPMEDDVLVWFIALCGGAFIGSFVAWCITSPSNFDPTGKRSLANKAGLFGGIGVGVATFLLRLSAGDLLSAIALSILEIAAVVMLESFAVPLRQRYQLFNIASQANAKGAAVLTAHRAEGDRRDHKLQALRQEIQSHTRYVEALHFAAQKPAEVVEAALNIARKSFYERQAEEHSRRLGIS